VDAETFYTYLWLRDDGTPYYVGKGHGKRAYRKGCPPHDRILVQPHPSEQDAFAAEIFLILYFGRKDLGAGCLRNLTDGGEGASGNLGQASKAFWHAYLQTPAGQQHLQKATAAAAEATRGKPKVFSNPKQRGQNLSAAHIGKSLLPEHRQHISDGLRTALIRSNNTSGVKGVSWDTFKNAWHARIKLHGRDVHLGRFKDKDDAIAARKESEKRLWQPAAQQIQIKELNLMMHHV
jgi:hypothetical protein